MTDKTTNTNRSDRLRELRFRNNNITQRQVADFLGVSLNQYQYWESKDTARIEWHHLSKLAELLHTTIDYIENQTPVTSYERESSNYQKKAKGRMRNIPAMALVDLPLYPMNQLAASSDVKQTISVLAMAVQKPSAVGIEIQGDAMAPFYRDKTIAVAFLSERPSWPLLEGVCAFVLKEGVLIKRIVENRGFTSSEIVCQNDNPDLPMQLVIPFSEIVSIYEIGDIVYAPKK